jgi:UDP-N-acetylmuramyl pentapeptide synthase
MRGSWSGAPPQIIPAIRHRLDMIEDGLAGFLYAPELFARKGGTTARKALLTAPDAIAKGAGGIICSEHPRNLARDVPCLMVDNASEAIARLARYRRAQSGAIFFAVTGSIGKSSTKNMIHTLATGMGPGHRSIFNYNDGMDSVHFTLANLSTLHATCATEFSEVGQIEQQISFYRPHVAVITNLLWEHIDRVEKQGYRGQAALERLAELAAGITLHMQPGGACILNADDANFALVEKKVRYSTSARIVTHGANGADVRLVSMDGSGTGTDIVLVIDGQRFSYRVGIPGAHMAANSVAAVAAVWAAGLPLEKLLPRLAQAPNDGRRGAVFHIPWPGGTIRLRDETIHSNLPGLRSMFALLDEDEPGPGGKRIAVLGQVNGLGLTMPDEMRALARDAGQTKIDRFYTIGADIRLFNEAISDRRRAAPHFQTLDQLEHSLREELRPGDVVGLKGTRSPEFISIRRLLDRLRGDATPSQHAAAADAVRVVIGGDTYFGEFYQEKRERNAELNYLTAFGYDYSAEKIAPLFRRADYAVVNLECALTSKQASGLDGRKDYILRGSPDPSIAALRNLNVGAVLLGNNHSMDFQEEGLLETLETIRTAGLACTGAGANRSEAQRAIVKELDVGGLPLKLAIISGYEFNSFHDALGFYAGSRSAGVNNINIDRLREQIAELRSDGCFVVVSPHWGLNYCFRNHAQGQMARRIVNAGADLILGHGPHMLNELACIDGVWTAYSIGNLIFNSEGEYARHGVQPFSLVAELEFSRQGQGLKAMLNLYPIVSCNQMTQFQPAFVDEDQFHQVVTMLNAMRYSPEERTGLMLREIDGRHCISLPIF